MLQSSVGRSATSFNSSRTIDLQGRGSIWRDPKTAKYGRGRHDASMLDALLSKVVTLLTHLFLLLFRKAQQHSQSEIFRCYPFEDSLNESYSGDNSYGLSVNKEVLLPIPPSAPAQSPRIMSDAMLRPLFRDNDLTNWQKAALSNSKWVTMLSDEQRNMLPHCKPLVPDYVNGCGEDANISGERSTSEVPPSAAPRHLLGVAVIKNAVVVDSTAYLKVGRIA